MGSQPIKIQLGKTFLENLVGNSCRKILQEIVVGQFLQGNLVGKSVAGKILREILLQENLAGKSCVKSCRKILWENPVGKSCGKSCGKILQENPVEKFF